MFLEQKLLKKLIVKSLSKTYKVKLINYIIVFSSAMLRTILKL